MTPLASPPPPPPTPSIPTAPLSHWLKLGIPFSLIFFVPLVLYIIFRICESRIERVREFGIGVRFQKQNLILKEKSQKLCNEGDRAADEQDYETAIFYYSEGIKNFPAALLYCKRSTCFIKMGSFAKALEDANEALLLLPNDETTLYCVGAAEKKLAMFAEAVAHFTLALELAPKNNSIRNALREAQEFHAAMQPDIGVAP